MEVDAACFYSPSLAFVSFFSFSSSTYRRSSAFLASRSSLSSETRTA